mgnify:CR=1 FL=1
MDKFKRSILLGVLITFSLSACGIKGPLYIPEDPSKRYPHNRRASIPNKIVAYAPVQFSQYQIS